LVDNELGHWVPPWEKLPYNNPTRNPLARSYSFVKTAKLLIKFLIEYIPLIGMP